MGFSRVSNLVPWIIFRAWIVTDLAGSGTASTWQGADKRKRRYGKRGKGGRLFQIFPSKGGDYSRKYSNSQFKSVKKWKYVFQKTNKTKRPRKKRKRDYFCESRTPDLRRVMVITCMGALHAVLCVITLKKLRYLYINIFILVTEWRWCELQKKKPEIYEELKDIFEETSGVLTVYKGRTFNSVHCISEEHMADKCLAKPSLLLMALYSLQFLAFTGRETQ